VRARHVVGIGCRAAAAQVTRGRPSWALVHNLGQTLNHLSFCLRGDDSVKLATLPADDGASLEKAPAGDVKAWLAELTAELAREVLATSYYTAKGRISRWEEG
jgi:hypothetical protein